MIFDPADGSLSLRRCTVGLRSVEQTLSVPSSVPAIGGTSISLPSRTSLGLVSATSPAPAISSRARSSAAPGIEKSMAIVGACERGCDLEPQEGSRLGSSERVRTT